MIAVSLEEPLSFPPAQPTMPAIRRSLRSTVSCLASGALLALLASACAAPVGDASGIAPTEPRAAKAAPGVTVSSTRPSYADRGTTVDVHVIGTGFVAGAQATWLLRGVADPARVRTNSTTYVSSTEVVANITVSSDADLAYWDVQMMAGGKNGVGTELFEITTAMSVGSGVAYGVNDAGDIVGGFNAAPTTTRAYVVSGADASFSDLGLQRARAISQDGLVAVGGVDGSTGSPFAGVWTRTAGAPWPAAGARLPDLPGVTQTSGLAYAVTTLPAEGLTLITGVLTLPATPVYWESTNGTWTSPARPLPVPPGYLGTVNSAMAIDASGDVAGQLNDPSGNSVGVVWRRVSGGYVADLLPRLSGYDVGRVRAVSPDGTILAGNLRQTAKGKQVLAPAFWTRDANGVYTVRLLPTLTGSYGIEGAVNGVTVVGGQVRAVGTSPSPANGTYIHGAIWTWTAGATDFQVRDMGGVGTKTDVTPYAINRAGTIAVGGDATGSIKWLLLP